MNKLIVDFQHRTIEEKRKFLEAHIRDLVVMDFSTIDPLPFYAEYPQLIGSFPGQFVIDGKCELHMRTENPEVQDFFLKQNITPIHTTIAGLGFIVPRTLSMIINEAYFALEEKVASSPDIDRAMKYGVNYPKGPFEWAQGKEKIIVELLQALKGQTGDERYEIAQTLKEFLSFQHVTHL